MEKSHPGYKLDRLVEKKQDQTIGDKSHREVSEEITKQCRDVADLARAVADRGSFRREDVTTTYVEGIVGSSQERPYTYIGTYFIPLDFNRYISVREQQSEGSRGDVKVALKVMTGDSEPETIATFSEEDSIELNGSRDITSKDLEALEELLMHISNSDKK
jgi:hypothetical protein